jgi:hypothetical protein
MLTAPVLGQRRRDRPEATLALTMPISKSACAADWSRGLESRPFQMRGERGCLHLEPGVDACGLAALGAGFARIAGEVTLATDLSHQTCCMLDLHGSKYERMVW